MTKTLEDVVLKFDTAIKTMTSLASESPANSYEHVRLLAKADALYEGLDLLESVVRGTSEAQRENKYDLAARMIWTDWVDAENVLKDMGEWRETLAFARATGTRDGLAMGIQYAKDAIKG